MIEQRLIVFVKRPNLLSNVQILGIDGGKVSPRQGRLKASATLFLASGSEEVAPTNLKTMEDGVCELVVRFSLGILQHHHRTNDQTYLLSSFFVDGYISTLSFFNELVVFEVILEKGGGSCELVVSFSLGILCRHVN